MRLLCCLLMLCSALISGCGNSKEGAVAAIEELGGEVTFDETVPGKPVIGVNLVPSKQMTDASLEHLKGMTSLETLVLPSRTTNTGLVHLKSMTNLQTLNLNNTGVTDAGLEHLKGLTSLQSLNLYKTAVTTAGVKDLQAALPKCKISK